MENVITNNVGQKFRIEGLNDHMALEDARAHIAAGRPFGRKNMRRLSHFYGVTVSFVTGEQANV